MTLEYKLSNPDPPNNGPVINSDDQIKATENILEDYYDNFLIIIILSSPWYGKQLNKNV